MTELSLATPKSQAEPGRLRRLFRWLAGDFRAALAILVLLVLVIVAVGAPWIAPYAPTTQDANNMLAAPGPGHLLGTDDLGRDIFSRLVYGAPATGAKSFGVSPLEAIRHALLPGIAIAAYGMTEVARQLRGSLLEVLSSQYVRTLHAKGLSMTRILWQHGLKNVSVNLFTIISLLVNRMLAATVVIEAVFAIPGLGSLIVRGAIQRDFPIVQGVVFAMVIVVIMVNLIADLLCAAVDPRIEQ